VGVKFDLVRFLAIFLGYFVPIVLWWVLSRRFPALWPQSPPVEPKRPKLDLVLAFAAVAAIILLNLAYNFDRLLPAGRAGWPSHLVFLANLAIIWSPIVVVLVWRRQGTETCLLSMRGLLYKVGWGLAGSLLGTAVYLLVEGRFGDLGLAVTMFAKFDPVQLLQSVIQFFGVGFLLQRIVAVWGRAVGIGICAALYGLVKYPYYLTTMGLGVLQATGIIAFSCAVAVFVVYIILDRRDVLVMAIVHVFLDLAQSL
jgi:hypothetical protein